MLQEQRESMRLSQQLELMEELDNIIENAMRTHASISQTMPHLQRVLFKKLEAECVVVHTSNDEGEPGVFAYPELFSFGFDFEAAAKKVENDNAGLFKHEGRSIIGHRLDVSTKYLGAVFAVTSPSTDLEYARKLVWAWAEQVDNFVGNLAEARLKQHAMERISDALKHPILEESISHALTVLADYVPYDELMLVFLSEDYLDKRSLIYRVFTEGEWRYSSAVEMDERIGTLLRTAAMSILKHQREDNALGQLSFKASHSMDVPIHGRTNQSVVGRVIVGTVQAPLTPFESDILDRFADYLRQRAVDFSREWKRLSRIFPQHLVHRLLSEDNYQEKYLTPRRNNTAIMYCDIAGFTRLSEEVLHEPERIGALIDRWSHAVVEIIWDTGGVFDKMVGDCVIGLWGPPFFEMGGKEACEAAAEAARRVRDYTRVLGASDEFPEIRASGQPLSVATGLNFGPLYVGFFGPSEDYTGFSSDMNNTARLQGLAKADEILVMETFAQLAVLNTENGVGALREAMVKNVKEPLVFRELL